MNATLRLLCVAVMLLITTHRLPAPIVENQEQSVPQTSERSRSAPPKHKPSEASEGNSAHRFSGTWRATTSAKNQNGNTVGCVYALIIKSGSAEETAERTFTLGAGAKWPNVPTPYNSVSPIHALFAQKSHDVKLDGSNLKINWPGFDLTTWTPKNLPRNLLMKTPPQPSTDIYILNGDRLIDTNGRTTGMWTRAK